MVIDTSALVAAIANEPDSLSFRRAIAEAPIRLMSAVTVLEARIVLHSRLGPVGVSMFEELLGNADIEIVAFDRALATAAFDAFRRFGRGQGSPAHLNIVDCAGYALAKSRSLPLLFKGDDFAQTDVASAIVRS